MFSPPLGKVSVSNPIKQIFGSLFSEASNLFIVDNENVPHNGDNCYVKGDENYTQIYHKIAQNTRPGSDDLRKEINKIISRAENNAKGPKDRLDNYVSFQDTRNKIIRSFQHLPQMIMNEPTGQNDKKIGDQKCYAN